MSQGPLAGKAEWVGRGLCVFIIIKRIRPCKKQSYPFDSQNIHIVNHVFTFLSAIHILAIFICFR